MQLFAMVFVTHLYFTFQQVKREKHFSAYLAAGMEQNATAVQQANTKRYKIDKRYIYMNSPLHVSCEQINFKSISTDECHSLVPSPVKGRPPLTKATDGTGGDG